MGSKSKSASWASYILGTSAETRLTTPPPPSHWLQLNDTGELIRGLLDAHRNPLSVQCVTWDKQRVRDWAVGLHVVEHRCMDVLATDSDYAETSRARFAVFTLNLRSPKKFPKGPKGPEGLLGPKTARRALGAFRRSQGAHKTRAGKNTCVPCTLRISHCRRNNPQG